MSYLPILTVVVVGAATGVVCAVRAIRGEASAKDVLYWSTFFTALAGAFVVWQLVLVSMLGDSSRYLPPTFDTKAQRSLLLWFGALSGALGAVVTAGLAVAASRVDKD
jgi:hypothetical protein